MDLRFISPYWPIFWTGASAVVFGKIYFKRKWLTQQHTAAYKLLLAHERVHWKQQFGRKWRWLFRYIFSCSFRLGQEVEAYGEQIKATVEIYGNDRLENYIDHAAKAISSFTYLFMTRYERAKQLLRGYLNG